MTNVRTILSGCVQRRALAVLFAVLAVPAAGRGDDALPARIELMPGHVQLHNARSRQQLVVTGFYGPEDIRDVTGTVTFESTDPDVVRIDGTVAHPVGDGMATITARLGDQSATAPVIVWGTANNPPISFHNETLAALTKAGCNMGACHGSPSGKGGFRLSLRGYDAPLDVLTLRTEALGRRTNILNPDDSLLLKKPLMEVAHGGGRRLKKGDAAHTVLRQWIAEGMRLDNDTHATLEHIEVLPKQRVFQDNGTRQQLFVYGYYSDGSIRDVTPLTVFSSSSESIATVNEHGLVEKAGRGEVAILARILDKMDTGYVTFLETVQGFAWNNPPEYNFVDQLVDEKLQQLQIPPSDLCSDDEFLRRATLDTTGRLPSVAETEAFLNDLSTDKRSRLVDQLLSSKDHAAFWALKWADVLRVNSGKLNATGVAKFNRWIYEGVLNDQPMDEFARQLLTASGSVYENPAANYWRASREPTDATETTAQLFLGIRIQCAKCHNHPFERWSQDNYYGISAAFARIGRKPGATTNDEVIFTQDAGDVTQPRTGKTMKVHLLLKGDVDVAAENDRRAVFAEWLTQSDNPFFAKSVANRIWGHLMGRGIVDPVDDFRDSNPPSNAALLDELSRQFVANGFSRKWVIRTIMNSATYQRSSRTNELNQADEMYFSHATTRMLTAEQLLDAICSVTAVPEAFPGVPAGTPAAQLPEPPKDHYFLKIFGQPQREMACECERANESNLSQALQMINGPTVHNKLRDDAGRINQLMVGGKTDDEIITALYLSAVSRTPSTEELTAAKNHIASSENRRFGLEDVGWAVLNSKEFLFQH
ncbi:MAG: DUF1553 domain-containing protein [Planctomycetaceae bacterium]|nr:DUF1553 domain-containing protein [Planctomycetaceae bacterium]